MFIVMLIGQVPSSPGPLYQNKGGCSAFDMEIFFHSHTNKTHFHKKGRATSLILKLRVFGNSEVAYCKKQCLCLQERQVNLIILFPGEIIKSLRTRNMAI